MVKREFKSIFAADMSNFLASRRALGFKYEDKELRLFRLDSFFVANGVSSRELTKEICDKWCAKRDYETIGNQLNRISDLRGFARYLNDIGVPAYIPPKGNMHKGPRYQPHIYTDDELCRFFAAVDQSRSVPGECPYRAQMMPVFFRILYTSGLRVSELRLIRIHDVDTEKGVLLIRKGKNGKDRLVPIAPELSAKCKEIRETIHANSPDDEYFFMLLPGRPMTLGNLYRNFRRYLEKAGISHTGRGPRIHDFRHTFCVNILRKWALERKDLLTMLPYMSAMLGHEGFEETSYYLRLTSQMYPYIQTKLNNSYQNIIEEPDDYEKEFY